MNSVLRREIDDTIARARAPRVGVKRAIAKAMCMAHDDHYAWHVYWDLPTGAKIVGPTFDYPREALAFVDRLNAEVPIAD